MAVKKSLVLYNGKRGELRSGDSIVENTPLAWDTMADADHTWDVTKNKIAITAALTNGRNLTVPSANTYIAGTQLYITFKVSPTVGNLQLIPTGSDTFNGAGAAAINAKRGERPTITIVTDGVSNWTVDYPISQLNYVRAYTAQTLAGNTARTPSLFVDTLVIITFHHVCTDGQTATGTISVDNSTGTYLPIAPSMQNPNVSGLGVGVTLNQDRPITFLVPKGCAYKWVASGSGTTTITSIYEISM